MRRWQAGAAAALFLGITSVAFLARTDVAPATTPDTGEVALSIRIDVSERQLYVLENGEQIGQYTVAVGKPGHATPRGSYSVRRIIWNPRWVPPKAEWAKNRIPREPGDPKNPMGRVKVFFKEPDYYIHGTGDEQSLGSAASHGCVRMSNDAIIELATLLVEHGGARIEPGLIQRLINRVKQTKEIRLTNAIPLRIET